MIPPSILICMGGGIYVGMASLSHSFASSSNVVSLLCTILQVAVELPIVSVKKQPNNQLEADNTADECEIVA